MMWIALAILWGPGPETPLERALVSVESEGNTWAVGSSGERGRWQVLPRYARVWGPLLHVPSVGQAEGRRILRKRLAGAQGDKALALCRYNAGNKCTARGRRYAAKVLLRVKR
jgi:hypothetical protein